MVHRSIELAIQRAFAGLARATAARPLLIALSTIVVLVGFGFGVFNIEVETDVLKLWVDDSTSLIDVRASTAPSVPRASYEGKNRSSHE